MATLGLAALGLIMALIGTVDLGSLLLIAAMSLGGFFSGVIMPSRDMIVRAITPPGSFGKVFGFVTTGFNFAGVLVPLCFGPLMDGGHPVAVFMVIAATALLAVAIVSGAGGDVGQPRRRDVSRRRRSGKFVLRQGDRRRCGKL